MTISVHDSFDFKDGAASSNEYLYDANGNMIQDKNKGIAQIQYNHLNMPTRITYDNGNMIDYLYSASGVKLEVTHTTNKLLMVNSNIGNSAAAKVLQQTTDLLTIDEPALAGRTRVQAPAASNLEVQTTDYINGYILENGTLSQIQLNGGYMTEDSQGKAVYHFYLQDHQGNNRVVVNGKTLAVEQVNHYYPYGGLFAESTGGEMQAFKYNGKELDRVCGLNWYDHGARHNDAAIGRWHCVDPLAEKYYSISPYVYCAGDPVNCVDPDGRDIFVLSAPNGAHGAGHMAMLIQDPKNRQWYLYSKEGTDEHFGVYGESRGDKIRAGKTKDSGFASPEEFFKSDLNPVKDGVPEYQKGFLLKCDSNKDEAAIEGAKSVLGENGNNKDYDVLDNNCAQTVQAGVSRAGFKDGSGTEGRRIAAKVVGRAVGLFFGIHIGASLGDYVGETAYEKSPNLIYERMKEQNKDSKNQEIIYYSPK